MLSNLKDLVKENRDTIILATAVVLLSLLSFAGGYITAKLQDKEPLKFEENEPSSWMNHQGKVLVYGHQLL